MRKLFLYSALVMSFSMAVYAQSNSTNTAPLEDKHLIVFYSWSGNSRSIANELQSIMGGSIVEVKPTTPYTSNYDQMLRIARQEISAIDNNRNYPAINTTVSNIAGYDTVFIIYPLWWSRMATPVQTFLRNHSTQLKGKTLALICTSASSGISQTVADAKRLCPESTLVEALHIRSASVSSAKNLLISWLEKTDLNRR